MNTVDDSRIFLLAQRLHAGESIVATTLFLFVSQILESIKAGTWPRYVGDTFTPDSVP